MMAIRESAAEATTPARPIRVLYIIDSLWGNGGAESSLLRLVSDLHGYGFECRVLTFHSNDGARPFLDRFPCPVDFWHLNNMYDRNAFRVGRKLRRLVQEQHIDIVHTFFQTADIWAGPITKFSGAKVLISSRRDMGILRSPKHHIGYRLVRSLYDQIHAVSEGVRNYTIATDGVDPGRTFTIHNGINAGPGLKADEVLNLREALGVPDGTPVITCLANFRRVKGIDILLRAAEIVTRSVPNARFLIAGAFGMSPADRAYTDELLEFGQTLRYSDSIRFLGHFHQVPALLGLTDVFALPSRSEGLSNALLEAMLASVPAVATAVGGNPEVVVDGVTGFLVPPEDPLSLANAILTMLADPDMRRRMGAASQSRVQQKFSQTGMVSQVRSAYVTALHREEAVVPALVPQ